ncbi:hypothetical protein CCYS_10110 [Corynebacterium cystitidis DSM 20524]|uniref:hypothetical protein n=1 Tax=Corynebacterium cystitidis TaxID=35757 RepID=UPI000B94862C|nr:hypothetical protein [Corynebacterium cystitidis]WJY82934.1 hypothetical protein CCYS_10110 [Corynebacterium cystitidis DSM 20524]SNV68878.1 Uncharacterised protein [Corynebacterium cystitidis]
MIQGRGTSPGLWVGYPHDHTHIWWVIVCGQASVIPTKLQQRGDIGNVFIGKMIVIKQQAQRINDPGWCAGLTIAISTVLRGVCGAGSGGIRPLGGVVGGVEECGDGISGDFRDWS